ncbi:hypothetical protein BWK69_00295 [Candidatus Parcubacteria bacterium A4]|nr:MAG: hypothetical protein BWK69_00295 [Candidatus Parcubacteria bacterium A4]
MNKNTISKGNNMKNNPIKAKAINVGATNNAKLQAYKKAVTDKATQEINKIEEDIKSLEQNKI